MYIRQKWQDWVNLLLGVWLFFIPIFAAAFTAAHISSMAAWNGYVFGAIIALISGVSLYRPETWEEWINLAIGLWLIVAPFVLGYTFGGILMWNSVIVGLLIAADALWAAISQVEPVHREHSHHA